MDAPPVQYVKTSNGHNIAYAVSGSGEPLVMAATGIPHVQLAWDFPDLGDFLRTAAERFRLIQLDVHGAGMSSRGLPDDLTMADFQPDLEAVVDHLKLEGFLLYGDVYQSYVAVEYAVRNPERVKALILANVPSSFDAVRAPAFYERVMAQDWDFFVHSFATSFEGPADVTQKAEDISNGRISRTTSSNSRGYRCGAQWDRSCSSSARRPWSCIRATSHCWQPKRR